MLRLKTFRVQICRNVGMGQARGPPIGAKLNPVQQPTMVSPHLFLFYTQ